MLLYNPNKPIRIISSASVKMAAKYDAKQMADTSKHEVMASKSKTEQAKKSELLREIKKLEIQIQAMEREKGTHIYSKRSDFRRDFSQLEDQDTKFTTERKTEKVKLRQQLEKISHMVKRFQRELKDIKPTPEFVEKLKVIMEDIEGTINTFKLQQRQNYEELMRVERVTTQEIQAMEKRFETWTQIKDGPVSARGSVKPPTTARDVTKDLPPEVAAFEKFLQQTGGVRGGWDEYDHQTFLKFRNRHKGKPIFLEHLIPALPTKTEGAIHDHETWYQEYLYLNDTKKDAIKAWRIKKEEEREGLLANADHSDTDSEDEMMEKRRAQYREKVEEEKKERFGRLNAWRVQKELEKATAEERKMKEEMAKAKKQEDDRKRQTEMKARVLEFKQQRQEEEEYLKLQQERWEKEDTERKRQLSAREIAKFRERDQRILCEKVMKNKAKEDEEREKARRNERIKHQVEMFVPHDPDRLLKPTKGWKERLKDPGPSGGGQLLHMPHRAVPSWRQGLH